MIETTGILLVALLSPEPVVDLKRPSGGAHSAQWTGLKFDSNVIIRSSRSGIASALVYVALMVFGGYRPQ
jgi:hypothetical protein